MYTQCPDCSTAFRVTAEVLRQAAGKVRCGGCGNAFNALEYLSESMPEQPAAKEPDPALPELTPEAIDTDNGLPTSISAKQSAALLKTLDDLAGSDIRIEDTGVEWRVFDDDETAEPAADSDVDVVDTPDTGVDEFLEDSPTPVDQFLTETPNQVEAGEIFEESANGPAKTPVDELRFDDNTPLPDDFDLDDESSYSPETPATDKPEPQVAEDEPPVDLDLSEPDEWTDILGEFDDPAEPVAAPLDAELEALDAELQALQESPRKDPNADRANEQPDESEELLDMDTQFALQAEAMGIDLSGMHESPAVEAEIDVDVDEAPEAGPEVELALEATGIEATDDPSGDEIAQLEPIEDDAREAPLLFGSIEKELEDLDALSDVFDNDFFDDDEEIALEDIEDQTESKDDPEPEDVQAFEEDVELDEDPVLVEPSDLKEELSGGAEPYPEDELDLGTESEVATDDDHEAVVPPLTEEEQTINRMIDQDLLRLAVEDEDGFASTIVIPEKDDESAKKSRKDKKKGGKKAKKKHKHAAEPPGFETIVMEGEHVRTAFDEEKLAADMAAAAKLVAQAKAEEAALASQSNGRRAGIVGGIVALVLLLVVQAIHQKREALATIPAFNNLIAPVYRAIGKPLSPQWDVRGWRFEARQDVMEEGGEKLTVISRIGNTSDKPLPYPLINIALTDRFEETIGNKTLDPAEYLPKDLDPGKLVQPGNNFTAVMSIDSPSDEAAGYNLKTCYRISDGQLRCHIPDFK